MQAGLAIAGADAGWESERLRDAIARHHGIVSERVVLGCGSGEILRMAAVAFTGPGKTLVMCDPTCELISQYAVRAGAEAVRVPLRGDYAHDLTRMLAAVDARTGLVYICNPNNPTGTMTRRQDLETFIEKLPPTTPVLIDEVYHDYVEDTPDTASLIDQPLADQPDERIIVVRSFSKIHGMAGLRVGYAIAGSSTANLMAFRALDANINVVAARGAAAALEDTSHVRRSAMLNADDRQEFANQANARMLRCIDSRTNFVMLDTQRQTSLVIQHFAAHDIVLAPTFPPFNTHIRISLGTPSEMEQFWRVWDLMRVEPIKSMGM